VKGGGDFALVSRESMLLSNNVMLVVAAGTVLLGTLYPLVLDALGVGKISVGPPYFDAVFMPLMVPMVFLMGLAPVARWKQASLPDITMRLRWAFAVAAVTALLWPLTMGKWSALISLGVLMAMWIITTIATSLIQRCKRNNSLGRPWLSGMTRSYHGMQLAHIGVAVFIIGVTMVNGYQTEKDVRMDVGDTTSVGGYEFRFDGVVETQGPNYRATQGYIQVSKDGREVMLMHPEKRIYNVQTMPMTEAAIDTGLFRDLYVSLGEPVSGGAWSVRIYYKPFVDWIWGGCLLMACGGLLAVSDRRYRIAAKATKPLPQGSDQQVAEART
jgi:cytochrome c-type biogenesis protein CcmF